MTRVASSLKDRLSLVEGETEVSPGVRIRELPGHRVGHVGVEFQAEDQLMLHCADALLHPLFIERPGWHCGIDSDRQRAAETRRELLGFAAVGELSGGSGESGERRWI